MKANASLHTLVDLSQNNVDDAARHLQELRTQREAAQSQPAAPQAAADGATEPAAAVTDEVTDEVIQVWWPKA